MKVKRLPGNPIIRPGMPGLRGPRGWNINGPTLLRVPAWVDAPLGKYYLYFGHHGGKYVRLAHADAVGGPYHVYKPGTLDRSAAFLRGRRLHVASPEIRVDAAARTIWMYFHANVRGVGLYRDQGQMTYVASSRDGLHFTTHPAQLAPFYLRVFRHEADGFYYGIAKNDNMDAVLVRSRDGLSPFERGHSFLLHMRHIAFYKRDTTLYLFYTKAFDAPERIYGATIDLTLDWTEWWPSDPVEVLRPESAWEGGDLPVEASKYGGTRAARALRDPFVSEDAGRLYLLYAVKGEKGIAIAELVNFPPLA